MRCRGEGAEQLPSPNVTRFFKVMFGPDIHKLLYLPPRFSRLMGHFDGQETILEDLTGRRWPVTLSQFDGSLAFHEGWSKFFDDHGLKPGHFLEFSYTHVAHFHVHVFGESAFEITNFDNVPSPRRSKTSRTNQDTVNVNSGDNINAIEKLSPYDSIASRRSQKVTSMDMEDPSLMTIRRDDRCYQGEGRSILYDLSCFEMQNVHTNGVDKSKKDSEDVGICIEKLDKSPESNVAPSHYVQMGHVKMAASHENQKINGNSGVDELADRLEKASEKGMDQTNTTAIQSKKLNGNSRDILTNKFAVKPSDNSNSSSGVKDDISKLCNALGANILRDSESPYVSRSKIAEKREYAIKRSCPESSVHSLVPKRPFGRPAMKIEPVMMNNDGTGQKPITATEDGMFNLQPIKVEPDFPSGSFSPFSVEVKSQFYLELPVRIPSAPGRRNSGRGKVVYLRDPKGRLWPILYPDLFTVKAFTGNWTRFCKHNSIMQGDECRFQLENGKMCAYRVDVIRSNRDGEHPK